MNENKVYIAKIEKIEDYDKATILFSIPNLVEKGKAYSRFPEKKPDVNDEVMVFQMSSQLNAMWYYIPISQNDEFILDYNGSNIIFKDGNIYIQVSNNGVTGGSIHLTGSANEREVTEGNQAMVYGNELKDWLNTLVTHLMSSYSLITPHGPTMAVGPGSILEMSKLQAKLPKLFSSYLFTEKTEAF